MTFLKSRSAIVAALIVLAAAVAGTAYATGSGDGISHQQIVVATSSTNSDAAKAVASPCFDHRKVTGGGADIDGNTTQAAIRSTWPHSTPKWWRAEGAEVDFTYTEWNIDARAICYFIASHAGYEVVTETSSATQVQSGVEFKTATAMCPPGKTVLGGGANVDGTSSNLALDAILRTSRPTPALDGWLVLANETDPTSASWTVTAYAICVNSGVVTTSRLESAPVASSNSTATATVTCPTGTKLTGGGADIGGGLGSVTLRTNAPTTTRTWTVVGQEEDETAEAWSVVSYAVCAAVA